MESSTKEALSKRLEQLRTERGWTQNDLVEKMYLSQRSISSVEKGNCTLSNLIQRQRNLTYIQYACVSFPRYRYCLSANLFLRSNGY